MNQICGANYMFRMYLSKLYIRTYPFAIYTQFSIFGFMIFHGPWIGNIFRLKLMDGGGLFLHIKPKGKYWHFRYRFDQKQKLLSFGVYDEVSLKEARNRRVDARKLIRPAATVCRQRPSNLGITLA